MRSFLWGLKSTSHTKATLYLPPHIWMMIDFLVHLHFYTFSTPHWKWRPRGTSCLRLCLSMQGAWVPSVVRELRPPHVSWPKNQNNRSNIVRNSIKAKHGPPPPPHQNLERKNEDPITISSCWLGTLEIIFFLFPDVIGWSWGPRERRVGAFWKALSWATNPGLLKPWGRREWEPSGSADSGCGLWGLVSHLAGWVPSGLLVSGLRREFL